MVLVEEFVPCTAVIIDTYRGMLHPFTASHLMKQCKYNQLLYLE